MVFLLAPLSILGIEQTQLKSLVRLSFLNLMSILELTFPKTVYYHTFSNMIFLTCFFQSKSLDQSITRHCQLACEFSKFSKMESDICANASLEKFEIPAIARQASLAKNDFHASEIK